MTPNATPIRGLLIDDDAMSRELLAVLLEAEGYAVESADSGDAALALLCDGDLAPDFVLTDMQMPGLSGAVLARELRRLCGPTTLLLAMSGSQPAAESIAGFDKFLLKPFTMQEIAAALIVHSKAAPATKGLRATIPSAPISPATPAAPASQSASNPNMQSPVLDRARSDEASPTPVLNETIYRQLSVSMPTPQLHEMYAMCVEDARRRITLMRSSIAAHDTASFVREAHAIKGSCGMLGATQLHAMAAELERGGLETAEAQGADEVNSLDELFAACDRLERMLGSRV